MAMNYLQQAHPTLRRPDRDRFPSQRVVGEIKPHTARGIAAGIAQLRTRPTNQRRLLVTYRLQPGTVATYDVLIADPEQLSTAIRLNSAAGLTSWRVIDRVRGPSAHATMRVVDCPPSLGRDIEPKVRAAYARWTGVTLAPKSALATGADIRHELADFLRELATELEAELP